MSRARPNDRMRRGKFGEPGTTWNLGADWAKTPFKFYKRSQHSGGVIIPFIASWPAALHATGISRPEGLPGLDLTDQAAAKARPSITMEAYVHDIVDLAAPEKSLIAQVTLIGWSKLVVPSQAKPDKPDSSSPAVVELFDLKADPLEKNQSRQRPARNRGPSPCHQPKPLENALNLTVAGCPALHI